MYRVYEVVVIVMGPMRQSRSGTAVDNKQFFLADLQDVQMS